MLNPFKILISQIFMKKRYSKYILLSFLMIFSISLISAQNFIVDKHNSYNSVGTSGVFYKSINNSNNQSLMRLLSSNVNTITVAWPESGYYYVTDNFFIEIDTTNPSSCTYTFNGETKDMIDNETNHYEFITGLIDNMASDTPYTIDFNCNDGSSTTSASTYFWINTTELDKYFFRNNLGNWNYLNSQRGGYINKDGFIEYYGARYTPANNENIINQLDILIFDNETSLQAGIKKYFLDEYGSKISVQSIGEKNFYVYTVSDEKLIAWKSGNYFVVNWVYPYENSTPMNFEISDDILNPYLQKYPNDLKYGTCGDGKVNVFNLEGKKEDCDKNSETTSCGSNIGECKTGQKTRKCKEDCTWEEWGTCLSLGPKKEVCDNKDNDCDGSTDEDFSLLNQTCFAGAGQCKEQGKYICSSSGLNITCNAVLKTPQKENCNDGIDNDCDGKIDFNDNDCIPLKINSPVNGLYFSSKNILFDIFSNYNPSDISYSYFDNRGKQVTVKLCSKCSTYNKTKSFNDGFYNITIAIGNKSQIFSNKKLSFLVDSTNPRISETLPKRGFTNGNFSIEFKEDNPKDLILNFYNQKKNLDLVKECSIEKGVRSCNTQVNLASLENKEIQYYFNITDITGRNILSKPIKLTVDTILPSVKINWTSSKGKVNFIFNVTEINFDKITYIDSSDNKPRETVLCSNLKNNICLVSRSFKKGQHNLTIYTKDDAGNIFKNLVNLNIS